MIYVTCAIIQNDEDHVLIVQRGENTDHPFKWEFPGGKIRMDETEEECVLREIKEELSMDIVICKRLPDTEFDYGIKQVRLIPFICDTLDEEPHLSEHIDFRWIEKGDLHNVDFSEADILVADNYLNSSALIPVTPQTDEKNDQKYDEEELKDMVSDLMGAKEAEWIAMSAAENTEILKKLLEYSLSDDRKLAFRASWTFSKVFDKSPELIDNYLPLIIDTQNTLDNESVLRSFLRMISLSDIGKLAPRHHGVLADSCFRYLNSAGSAIAVKAYSMEIIYKLALIYPELANELSSTIKILEEDGSAGIVARGRMVMKKLAGLAKDR